jgi:hypothetical protein
LANNLFCNVFTGTNIPCTVDSFQGQEATIIIFSNQSHNIGFSVRLLIAKKGRIFNNKFLSCSSEKIDGLTPDFKHARKAEIVCDL